MFKKFYFAFIFIFAITTYSFVSSQNRKDFLQKEILQFNSFILNKEVRNYKFESMKISPFSFYRATAHLFYKDIAQKTIQIPENLKGNKNIETWVQGDAHIQNVGFFYNNSKLVFNLNDFDESFIAPFYWDIIRFATSIFLIRPELDCNFNETEIKEQCLLFLNEYKKTIKTLRFNNSEINAQITAKNTFGFIKKTFKKILKKTHDKILQKWTIELAGTRKFDFKNPKLSKLTSSDSKEIFNHWDSYLQSIKTFYLENPAYFDVKDSAIRNKSGLGSLGVKKYYLLLEGKSSQNSDDIIIQIKEQKSPSMLLSKNQHNQYNQFFKNHVQRSHTSQIALIHNLNPYTGILLGKKEYNIKLKSSYQKNFEGKNFNKKEKFSNFLIHAAKAYAHAHSRSDQDFDYKYVPHSFEKNAYDALERMLLSEFVNLSQKYSEQVKKDYEIFKLQVDNGKIK